MIRFRRAFCVALVCLFSNGLLAVQSVAKDDIVRVPSDDGQMNAAIERARETLPVFWKAKDNPSPGQYGFMLKVRIRDGDATEHFWLADIEPSGDGYVGTIDNEPQTVTTVKYRQRYSFPQEDISDWIYIEGEKFYGAFTLRALLQHMPAESATRLKEQLAFEPE